MYDVFIVTIPLCKNKRRICSYPPSLYGNLKLHTKMQKNTGRCLLRFNQLIKENSYIIFRTINIQDDLGLDPKKLRILSEIQIPDSKKY